MIEDVRGCAVWAAFAETADFGSRLSCSGAVLRGGGQTAVPGPPGRTERFSPWPGKFSGAFSGRPLTL